MFNRVLFVGENEKGVRPFMDGDLAKSTKLIGYDDGVLIVGGWWSSHRDLVDAYNRREPSLESPKRIAAGDIFGGVIVSWRSVGYNLTTSEEVFLNVKKALGL